MCPCPAEEGVCEGVATCRVAAATLLLLLSDENDDDDEDGVSLIGIGVMMADVVALDMAAWAATKYRLEPGLAGLFHSAEALLAVVRDEHGG